MAFKKQPPELLINLIHRVQERDAIIYFIRDQLAQGQVPVNNKDYTFNNQGLLK